jgi:hypothetical protein
MGFLATLWISSHFHIQAATTQPRPCVDHIGKKQICQRETVLRDDAAGTQARTNLL